MATRRVAPTPKTTPAAKPTAKTSNSKAPSNKTFNSLVILSPGAELVAAEAELRLRSVARHLGVAVPPVVRVAEIEATPEATSLALYRAFRAVGRGGPVLYLVGGNAQGGALCALTTDWGNTILAPNDGSLALLAELFKLRGIPHTLTELDHDGILSTEQRRMNNPDWQPAADFPLRDTLAPAAALALAGTLPTLKTSTKTVASRTLLVHSSRWASTLATLPLKLGHNTSVLGLRQAGGTWLLNLTLDPLSFEQLVDEQATFTLSHPHTCGALGRLGLSHRHTLVAMGPDLPSPTSCGGGGTCAKGCGCAKATCANHLHLSPLQAPAWDERLLAISLHACCAGKLSSLANFTLTRTR